MTRVNRIRVVVIVEAVTLTSPKLMLNVWTLQYGTTRKYDVRFGKIVFLFDVNASKERHPQCELLLHALITYRYEGSCNCRANTYVCVNDG